MADRIKLKLVKPSKPSLDERELAQALYVEQRRQARKIAKRGLGAIIRKVASIDGKDGRIDHLVIAAQEMVNREIHDAYLAGLIAGGHPIPEASCEAGCTSALYTVGATCQKSP